MADKAHILTDEKLEEMEKRLSAIYSRADREITKKYNDLLQKIAIEDREKREQVKAGKLSEDEYKKWLKKKLLYEKQAKERANEIAAELSRVNEMAMAYVNGELPEIYGLNYNAIEKTIDEIGGYSFTLVDADTVRNLALNDETLLPYKYIDEKKDIRWNAKKVNAEVLQGILQGESIPDIAKRLSHVTEMNKTAAIRNARTSVTSAECKGRQDSYIRATNDGIILKREWIATNDGRTRHSHRLLDGQIAEVDRPFKSELGDIMYPGDPEADPPNVYNCRCTIAAKVMGFKKVR
jgi:SPP1 gp7 family putative phage head morphogenesis protein